MRQTASPRPAVPPALEVARKAPGAELFRGAGGHAEVLRTEVDFLHRHTTTAAPKKS
ncbi:hypothetical protein [Streptomyces sp. GESEQ-35]|uniref:hypothetical protein n=1 Tax=Streptomyces sp. GESEQ-35 TaxID=2812657 RepID=UPI001B333C92|nr:hypothetical protein [Streptomyces sp. GESEQ-35]